MRPPRQGRRPGSAVIALVAIGLLVAATGCHGSSGNAQQPGKRLSAAKQSFDHASYIGFTLSTDDLPSGVDGLLSATGTGTHAPAFVGHVKIRASLDFTAPLIAVNHRVYVRLPFSPWTTVDPSQYGAPDPAQLMDRQAGISSLFTAITHASTGSSTRQGSTVLTEISGRLPGRSIQTLFPSAGTGPFQATFSLTKTNMADKVAITGPFYPGHSATTYTISLDLRAHPVSIKPPG